MCWRGCRASVRCSPGALANMRCASGSIRIRPLPTISAPAKCWRRCARRTFRSRPAYAEPGANSLAVEHEVLTAMRELKRDFPPGVDSIIIYNPTVFIAKSIHEVIVTIFVAILLVVGVVFLFLQSWRATIVPVMAIPVSLVGTFTILAAFGISLNNLSL